MTIDALQSCLGAEHAALYGYGVLGGRLSGQPGGAAWQELADESYAEHRARRDTLTAVLLANDAEPVVAEPAYATPFDFETLADCQRLARLIETRCTLVYGQAVTQTVTRVREICAVALTDCAVRAVRWGQPVSAFPGLRER